MKIYPEDIAKAVEQSKKIAEDSKKLVRPVQPEKSPLDQQWEAVRRSRQQ